MTKASRILREAETRRAQIVEAIKVEPFRDHRVYPQGWTYAMIEREADRRYRSIRDVERAQDWTWAVDEPAVRYRLSEEAFRAAHALYDHQQAAKGDFDRVEKPRVFVDGSLQYLGRSLAQERSGRLAAEAKAYVRAHPEMTEAREAVFERLFEERQPTLAELRWRARPGGERVNAKGNLMRMKQGDLIERIKWCCEALADIGAGLRDAPYEMTA